MQKPFSAHRLLTLAALLAALPAAAAPNNITDLGTLVSDNWGESIPFAISADGSVIVGQAAAGGGNFQPTSGRAATGQPRPTSARSKPIIRVGPLHTA